jgi:cell division protease FtsH
MRLPERDRLSVTREKLHADLAVAMGGRAAEELIFGEDKVTTGASSDIAMATSLAENMVMRWGLSKKLGPIDYADDSEEYFAKQKVSAETRKIIDEEVKEIVEKAHQRARKILTDRRKDLETLAQGLLEYETLSGDEIKELLSGKKPNKPGMSDGANITSIVAAKKSSLPTGGIKKEPKPKPTSETT